MTKFQKKENTKFFQQTLRTLNEGGSYLWPAIGEVFTMKEGKFFGTEKGVKQMRKVTVAKFHSSVIVG